MPTHHGLPTMACPPWPAHHGLRVKVESSNSFSIPGRFAKLLPVQSTSSDVLLAQPTLSLLSQRLDWKRVNIGRLYTGKLCRMSQVLHILA